MVVQLLEQGVGLFYEGGTGANLLNALNVKLVDTLLEQLLDL